MARTYQCRPSVLMDIVDPYTAYCFDEACAYIMAELENKNEPEFKAKYSSFKDMYNKYEQ